MYTKASNGTDLKNLKISNEINNKMSNKKGSTEILDSKNSDAITYGTR